MNKKFRYYIIGLLTMIVFAFLGSGANALTMKTTLLEENTDPGSVLERVIKLQNEKDVPITVSLSVKAFSPNANETGSPVFEELDKTVNDLQNWISFPVTEIKFEPKEIKDVNFKITVPSDATPGGHYAIVLSKEKFEGKIEGSGAGIEAQVGTIIAMRVAGEATEAGEVVEFSTAKKFYNRFPVNFMTRYANTGNVHYKPEGVVEVKNMFGGVARVLNANESSALVYPNSIRKIFTREKELTDLSFVDEVKAEFKNFGFGRYTAKLDTAWGTQGKTFNSEVSFWVISWRAILIVIIALFVVRTILSVWVKRAAQKRK